ncbi:MAG: hypothetical protein H0X71_02985 [Rubrobacter sp.]|nr:hypothetical protein [Rubrobacter sp.]
MPIVVLALCVLLRAGYELWKEEEEARKNVQTQLQEAEQKHEELRRENEQLKRNTGNPQSLGDRRRERVERWRRTISRFDFREIGSFGRTNTYAEMKPHLQPGVIEMLEAPRTAHIGNPARGDLAYGYTLLDEVARIEKEWELI